MHFYLYQITNLVNQKIYVGVHKTKSLDDGYMGSGKVIKSAIEKHGIENFTRVILETFENAEAMYAREKEVVTEEFLQREDVYNLRRGGLGGFDFMNTDKDTIQKRLNSIRENPATGSKNSVHGKMWITNGVESIMIDVSEKIPCGWSRGRLISNIQKSNVRNYRTGTVRITNGVQNKYMKQSEYLPDGWQYGWCKS